MTTRPSLARKAGEEESLAWPATGRCKLMSRQPFMFRSVPVDMAFSFVKTRPVGVDMA